jgi:uncharacterized protein
MEDLGPFAISNSHSHEFLANSNGQRYQVWVATPGKVVPGQSWPVLYMTDANTNFGMVVETARFLAFAREIPPVLVVGVGYAGTRGLRDSLTLRNYELTPSDDPDYRERAAAEGQQLGERGLGGADGFLQFITGELAPFVEERYNASPDDRTLFGFSLGGLFATHALLQEPLAFQRFVIGSPSLWWNDREMLAAEERRASGSRSLPARVFLSVGLEEEAPANTELTPSRMVGNMLEFAGRLAARGYSGLDLSVRLLNDEGHTVSPMLVAGLKSVYRKNPAGTPDR